MTNTYLLIPTQPTSYEIKVQANRLQNKLVLKFELTDPKNDVFWPKENEIKRQDFLWESTCFEAFIGTPDHSPYFELNLSPSRAWNLYRFTDYRTPNVMPPVAVTEPALLKLDVKEQTIDAEIDLNALQLADQEITLGLTAVVKTSRSLEYLAIHHPKPEADFHDSLGWTIRLLPEA